MSALEHRPSQTQQIVNLLRSRKGQWVSLPEILALKISQYNARIYQARHEWGLTIQNREERVNGQKHTFFRIVEETAGPARGGEGEPQPPCSLFGDLHVERCAFDVNGGRP